MGTLTEFYCANHPPSMGIDAPVILRAPSAQRLRARKPTSSTVVKVPDGCFSSKSLRVASACAIPSALAFASICASTNGVNTQPGQIALQVIPDPAVSSATTFVNPTSPCLADT